MVKTSLKAVTSRGAGTPLFIEGRKADPGGGGGGGVSSELKEGV